MFRKLKKIIDFRKKKIPVEKTPKKQEKKVEEVHHIIEKDIKNGRISIDTKVKDIMIRDVKTVIPDDNVRKALNLLSEFSVSMLPVLDGKKVVGMVTELGILNLMKKKKYADAVKDEIDLTKLEDILVKEIMENRVTKINQGVEITDASDLLSQENVNALVVVNEKEELVGIVVRENVIKGMVTEYFVKSVQKGLTRVVETNIDKMMDIVEKQGIISIQELSNMLNEDPNVLEKWARYLEERELVMIEYTPMGSPRVRKIK